MDPRELMHAHADALFTLDRSGDLFCVNEPAGDVAPRFFLGMTVEGPLVRFRTDVDLATRDELTQTAARIEAVPDVLNRPLDPNPFLVILARSKPIEKTWLVPRCQPMSALVLEGRAVAVCCSVRRTDTAHEAGVETAAALRGRGHGAAAVRAWVRAVREAGRLPLYSTSWQNGASQAVARKLGRLQFGNDLHVT